MEQLLKRCPRFKTCEAPICPLDKDMPYRYFDTGNDNSLGYISYKGDEICKLQKSRIRKIAQNYPEYFWIFNNSFFRSNFWVSGRKKVVRTAHYNSDFTSAKKLKSWQR